MKRVLIRFVGSMEVRTEPLHASIDKECCSFNQDAAVSCNTTSLNDKSLEIDCDGSS